MEYEIAVTGILIVVLVFISIFESAFGQLGEVSLRSLASDNRDKRRSSFLKHLIEQRQLYILTIIFGLQCTILPVAILLTSVARDLSLSKGRSLAVAISASLVIGIIFRQFVPRLITQNNPAKVLLFLLPLFEIYYKVFSIPARIVYRFLAIFRKEKTLLPEKSFEEKDEEDIKALLDVGTEEGIIEEEESKMIHSVLEFKETRVDEVMTPRTKMIALEATSTIEQARDLIVDSKHSRIPTYRESIDNVDGIVYIHDVMTAWRDGKAKDVVSTISRPAYFVPETKQVAELLKEMKKEKKHIALVVDEYGVTAGLVTIEDLIEEIVGEIDEEGRDRKARDIIQVDDGIYLVKGTTAIREVELLFGKELETDDFSTIAGFIIKHAGRV
ncbi:MAG: HlyC/CorC family transporter, partial [Blastocatellia bacterium]|nr:HlyC/CorC family transporter [Blastocatellia bacterium]